MRRAFGKGAEVPDLANLAGQGLQEGYFVQEIFQDFQNAPQDILDLQDAIEIFLFVVRDIKRLFQQDGLADILLDTGINTNYMRALQSCLQVIKEIIILLRGWLKTCESHAGEKAWWGRVKVTDGQTALRNHAQRLELAMRPMLAHRSDLAQFFLLAQQIVLPCHKTKPAILRMHEVRGSSHEAVVETVVENRKHEQWPSCIIGQCSARVDFWLIKIYPELRNQRVLEAQTKGADSRIFDNRFWDESGIHSCIRLSYFCCNSTRSNCSGPQQNGFDMQLMTYNFVPGSSPIIDACQCFDVHHLQDMFRTGQASPFDYFDFNYEAPLSILDYTITLFCDDEADTSHFLNGTTFIKYLLTIYKDASRMISPQRFQSALSLIAFDTVVDPVFVDAIRMILGQLSENPFEQVPDEDPSLSIDIERSNFPFASFLLQQQYHSLDSSIDISATQATLFENDRTMLLDLPGSKLEQCLRMGGKYTFWCLSPGQYHSLTHSMYGLIQTAKFASHPKVVMCCKNRLALLVRDESRQGLMSITIPQSTQSHAFDSIGCISPFQYALELGLHGFMEATLLEAGFASSVVSGIYDETYYAGIPELFDGNLRYKSMRICRKEFISSLVRGKLLGIDKDDDAAVRELAANTGIPLLDRYFFEYLLERANRAFSLMVQQGIRTERAEADIVLVPKVDFPSKYLISFHPRHTDKEKREEWVDIRDWLKYDEEE